jgi:shikimate dehydrogenase
MCPIRTRIRRRTNTAERNETNLQLYVKIKTGYYLEKERAKLGLIISGQTRICGIIGNPIEHSISPAMQNAAFSKMKLDYVYLPFRVNSDGLAEAMQGVRGLNLGGLNITIPHKVAVIPLLDEIDPLVENLGAVNTVTNDEGYLKGYNTDAAGFLGTLTAAGVKPAGKKAVILGAGGAARAAAFVLLDRGADIILINRHLKPGNDLAGKLNRLFRRDVQALELNAANLRAAMGEAEILVNTTPVGMWPQVGETLVPKRMMKERLTVIDIIYNPIKTRLLYEAEAQGARTISGLEMLVRQGAAAFEHWTGQKAPVDVMRRAARRELEK